MEAIIGPRTHRRLALCAAALAIAQFTSAPASATDGPSSGTVLAETRTATTVEPPAASNVGSGLSTPVPAGEVLIYAVTNTTHTDLVIPRAAFSQAPPVIKSVVDKLEGGPWIVIGWGPYWFGRSERGGPFHSAPVLMANGGFTLLVPQFRSRLRLAALDQPGPPPREDYDTLIPLKVTTAGLERSIERIDTSFERGPDGGPILSDIKGAAPGVLIYRSREMYHVTHECNHWAAEVLRAGGVNTTAMLDLMPGALRLDLKVKGAQSGPDVAIGRSPHLDASK
jgi:hypothetical protein